MIAGNAVRKALLAALMLVTVAAAFALGWFGRLLFPSTKPGGEQSQTVRLGPVMTARHHALLEGRVKGSGPFVLLA
jgi:hypothetical protein